MYSKELKAMLRAHFRTLHGVPEHEINYDGNLKTLHAKKYQYLGKEYTAAELYNTFVKGTHTITYSTLRNRLFHNWDVSTAINTPPIQRGRKPRFIQYKGLNKTIHEWADMYGITYGALQKRLKLGWTIERALETPYTPEINNLIEQQTK